MTSQLYSIKLFILCVGQMSTPPVKKASAVPKTMLRRRVRNKNKRVVDGKKNLGGQAPMICEDVENDLVTYIRLSTNCSLLLTVHISNICSSQSLASRRHIFKQW